jgi:hypothetical protein
MRKFLVGVVLSLVVLLPAASSAVINTYTSSFGTEPPTFDRPNPDPSTNLITGLSDLGNIFPYHAFDFTVPSTGNYQIRSTQTGFDGVIILYGISGGANPFNPADPLTNALFGDDDEGSNVCIASPCTSLINDTGGVLVLNSGWSYTLVTTSFDALDSVDFSAAAVDGDFTNVIETLEETPEPSTVVLLSAGLGSLIWLRRRSS